MINIILIIIAIVLIWKYWEELKNISALVMMFIFGVMFVISLAFYHIISTWRMIGKKDKHT